MLYLDIIKFSFLRFFAYPWEILARVVKRIVELTFLILFWSLVAKASQNSINLQQIISYVLVAMGIGDLVMSRWGAFGGDLGRQIKSGEISKYLIKPVRLLPTIYSIVIGRNGMNILLAVVNIIIGLVINPPKTYISLVLFVIFFVNAWFIATAYNIIEGSLFFHFGEAMGIRNSFQHVLRVLSGAMIPIYLFPPQLKQIVRLTPFPGMVYGPANALSISVFTTETLEDILIVFFWSIFLNFMANFIWRRSIKKYEAIGI